MTFDAGSVSARLEVDRSAFNRDLDAAKADADRFTSKPITAKITADGTEAKKTFDDLTAQADKLGSKAASIKIGADTTGANTDLDKTSAKADALSKKDVTIKVKADASQANAEMDKTSAKADALSRKDVTVKVKADTAGADTALDKTSAKADALGAKNATVKVDAATTQANADLDKTALKVDALGRKTATVKVKTDVDTSGVDKASKKVDDFKKGIDKATAAFPLLATAAVGLGPAAIPVLGTVTAAILPLAGAIGSAGTGLAAFGLLAKQNYSTASTAATAVQKAQDNYNVAIANGTKQATAYKTEQIAIGRAYAELSPQQIALSKQVSGLQQAWQNVQQATTPVISGALIPWIGSVTKLMQYLIPLVTPVANLFKAWGTELDKALSGNAGKIKTFMDAFAARSAANIWNFGAALVEFAKGAGALIHDIAPHLAGASTGIAKLAYSFAEWAKSKKTADDIKGFFAWAKAEAPTVKKFLEELATALGHLIQAAAYSGGGYLTVLTTVLGQVAKLPPAAIVALADAYVALSLGLRAAAAAATLWSIGEGLVTAATWLWTAAQTALDAALVIADIAALPVTVVLGLMAVAVVGVVAALAALAFGIYELVTHWTTSWHAILAAVDAAVGALKIAWDAILVAAQDVWGWIKTNWPLLGAILLGPIAVAVLEIVKHWDTIKKAFSEALTWIKGLLGAAGSWLSNIFGDFAKPVTAEFDKIKNFVTTSFDAWWKSHGQEVKEVWNTTWTAIKDIFVSKWNTVVSVAKAGWAVITGVFRVEAALVTAVFKVSWDVMATVVKIAWAAIQAVTKTGWAVITGVFRVEAALVTAVFKTAWDVMATVVKVAWAAIQAVIKTAWAVITGIFRVETAVITVVFKNGWDVMATVVKIAWAAIQAVIKIAWDIIVGIISVGLDLITGHWKQAWTDVKNTATQVWNTLKQFFGATLAAILALFTQVLNNIKSFLSTTWSSISSTAQSAWNAIKAFFASWWSAVSGLFTQVTNTIKSTLSTAWNSIESTAKTVFGGILTFFGGFWSALKAGFAASVTAIGQAWTGIENVVKAPVQWVIQHVYDDLIVPFWNATGGAVGLPQLKKMAEGGVVPGGYSRDDNQLVWMRSGEGVLQPGAVAALGGPSFIDWANSAYGDVPVGSSSAGHYLAGGTAPGRGAVLGAGNPTGPALGPLPGIAHDIGSVISDIGNGIFDTLASVGTKIVDDASKLVPGKSGVADAMRAAPPKIWSAFLAWVTAHAPAPSSGGGGGVNDTTGIPWLGTTLPPIATMIKYFGPQGDPSHETMISFAGHPLQINKVLAGNATALGSAMGAAGLAGGIRDVGGFRTSIGGSGSPIPFSMHQFGAAFDINEDGGPNGNWQTMTLPAKMVALAQTYSWFNGQNWGGGSRDGGHFQFTGGGGKAAVGAGSPGKGDLIANASAIGGYLLSHGANKIAAAGIMGNMLQESGGNPLIGGGGLIQITGANPTSLAQSLAQTIAYINSNGGMGPINAAQTVAQATEIFMNQYERPAPATENLARRLAGAAAAYAAGYAGGGLINAGTGPRSDDVLIRASKGETVVSADHSRVLAPAFQALGVPGYAAGGLIPGYAAGGLIPSSATDKLAAQYLAAWKAHRGGGFGAAWGPAGISKQIADMQAALNHDSMLAGAAGLTAANRNMYKHAAAVDHAKLAVLGKELASMNTFRSDLAAGSGKLGQWIKAAGTVKSLAGNVRAWKSAKTWEDTMVSQINAAIAGPAGPTAGQQASATSSNTTRTATAFLNAWKTRKGGGWGAAWGPVSINPQIDAMNAALQRDTVLAGAGGLSAAERGKYSKAASTEKAKLAVLNSELNVMRQYRSDLGGESSTIGSWISAAGSSASLANNVKSWKATKAWEDWQSGQISAALGWSAAQGAANAAAAAAGAAASGTSSGSAGGGSAASGTASTVATLVPGISIGGTLAEFGGIYGIGNGSLATASGDTVAAMLLAELKQKYGQGILAALNGAGAGGGFDSGGWLQPGTTLVRNNTGRPEPVLNGDQWDRLSSAMAGSGDIGDKLDRIANLLAAQPRATASGVSDVLNGTAHIASFRSRYPRN